MTLFRPQVDAALLENVVAVELMRRFGVQDEAVCFFKKGDVEVDFYLPNEELAIEVCWALNSFEALKRVCSALVGLKRLMPCRKLIAITRDEEYNVKFEGETISMVPIGQWLIKNDAEMLSC